MCATPVFSQSPYGSVRGYVYDEQKSGLAGGDDHPGAALLMLQGVFTAVSGRRRLVSSDRRAARGPIQSASNCRTFAKLTREPVICASRTQTCFLTLT